MRSHVVLDALTGCTQFASKQPGRDNGDSILCLTKFGYLRFVKYSGLQPSANCVATASIKYSFMERPVAEIVKSTTVISMFYNQNLISWNGIKTGDACSSTTGKEINQRQRTYTPE